MQIENKKLKTDLPQQPSRSGEEGVKQKFNQKQAVRNHRTYSQAVSVEKNDKSEIQTERQQQIKPDSTCQVIIDKLNKINE